MVSISLYDLSPMEIYRKTLIRHKGIIINNKYAQELEKKYNRFRHKSQQEKNIGTKVSRTPHVWPIHSNVFTKVLRTKLNTVLTTKTAKSATRPSTRVKSHGPRNVHCFNKTLGTSLDPTGFSYAKYDSKIRIF